MRKRLAALSFTEKVKILEKLRDRSITLAASGLRRNEERRSTHKATTVGQHANTDIRLCECTVWEPCVCGHQPSYHCALCCLELTPEQFKEARKRGWYPSAGT